MGRRGNTRSDIDGILLVDKPEGITSAAAVAVVKKGLGGPKVGHLGTLDPFASGLLPMCLGEGTKIAPYLNTADKAYTGTVRLGHTTDTLDITGTELSCDDPPDVGGLDLEALAAHFTGDLEQVPPAYSAIKKDGVRMYELARKGEAPELEPRPVTIHGLRLAAAGPGLLDLEMTCSKGTYVRSLARDIGEHLGCGAVLAALRRTKFGAFGLDAAVQLDRVRAPGEGADADARAALLAPAAALTDLSALPVSAADGRALRSGQQAALLSLGAPAAVGQTAKVVDPDGGLVAVVKEQHGRWRLDRLFQSPPVARHDRAC